jgi:hypothetical protein
MNDKTKTAVEWLFDQLPDHLRLSKDGMDMLNRAKEIEREQIQEAYKVGFSDGCIYTKDQFIPRYLGSDEYYSKTYGKP